ncbi:MAG: inositol monophosphatase [Candidatus Nomurabacteria bacterium]|nr:MAG: inositol monophosphatase [Candidatus Nomurabacteria bacterium]
MIISPEVIRESQQLVIDVFKSFRDELMESYGKIKHSSKQDGSPVTKLDVKIEQALKTKLADAYPDFGFHGEETDDVEGTIDATWFVDPIDGTRSFMHGLPDCSNMAGLVVDGVTVASVIYHFATDELYTAIRGLGAYRNGESIHINNTVLDDSIVFAGAVAYKDVYPVLSYSGLGMYAPIGASGYEFTRLAQGNIQGVTKLRSGSMLHDDIPGVLLVQEAGGEIVSFEGRDYDYKTLEFVAATPNVAKVVREQYDAIKKVIT